MGQRNDVERVLLQIRLQYIILYSWERDKVLQYMY
jgi:hypothetical protein